MSIKLSIIIPVYNKYGFTKSCLHDLSQLPKDHEIIVVDNASSDETQLELENLSKSCKFNLIYIRNNENYGFAKACNAGYAVANGQNILFLNNDIRVKSNYRNWTNIILSCCDEGLVGPTMGQLDNNFNFIQEANKVLPGKSYMSGWCLASSKENWKKLDTGTNQIFSEDFFCYFEDTDLSFRAKQIGVPFNVVEVPVVHFGKISSKQLNTYKLYNDAKTIFVNKWRGKI